MSNLKPGMRIELIFESDYLQSIDNDYLRSNLHFRKALVYDVDERKIIISDTSPPLTKEHQGKVVRITFLAANKENVERYGFPAELAEFLKEYEIDSRQRVSALVLKRKAKPEQMNVRLHFRIRPTFGTDLALAYQGINLNIVDISLGGAQFSHYNPLPIKAGNTIRLKLTIDHKEYELNAAVIRVWLSAIADRGMDHQFAAVNFLPGNRDLEQSLSNKILSLQRQLMLESRRR